MTYFRTLETDNMFEFVCPTLNATVQIRGCVLMREKHYVGKVVETRRGCHACITSNKCVAAEIVRRIAFNTTDATDECYSSEKKVGKIPADVLERIKDTIVRETTLAQFSVPTVEAARINSAESRIFDQIKTAPRSDTARRKPFSAKQEDSENGKNFKRVSKSKTSNAAKSGDMSAAINDGE